jgi:microcystin-dependent protein
MTLFKWSRTASSNATADGSINWAEGQPPSSVNDSARATMAAVAKYRDDISGAIVTSGASTAYTVTSYQSFGALTQMDGAMIAFTPHATNGTVVTLNVDGLGAKPLRSAPSAELLAGTLIQGTPYCATYNNGDGAWYLRGFYGNPYNIPLGGILPYVGATAPNSSFALPYGQAISRTTYASLFALVSTTFGAGDGSTTFNVPDLRGRVIAALDNMGGSAAGRLTTIGGGTTMGASGGGETVTLAQANLPNVNLTLSGAPATITVQSNDTNVDVGTSFFPSGGGAGGPGVATTKQLTSTGSFTPQGSSALNGGVAQTATANLQPTILVNLVLRII